MNVRIKRLDDYGRGIGLINDKITFINNALIDELIEYEIVKVYKNYNIARNLRVLEKSTSRVNPPCAYYYICGGCNLEHLDFVSENNFKKEKVKNIFRRYALIDIGEVDIISSEDYHYRNKITLHVKDNHLGLVEEKTNNLVNIDKCLLIDNKLNNIIEVLQNIGTYEKIETIMLRVGNKTEEVMLYIKGELEDYKRLLNITDSLIINDKIYNKEYITSFIGNKKFHVRRESFMQVNNSICEALYEETKNIIKKLNSKNVLDLYSGIGTISIYISDVVDSVLGVEVVPSATVDANENKKINDASNVKFINGKVEEKIANIKNIENYDTIILDPPRSGVNKKVREVLKEKKINNIIYISCDPFTLARDIKDLKEVYDLKYIKLFNMFPRTYHVECLTLLSLKALEK